MMIFDYDSIYNNLFIPKNNKFISIFWQIPGKFSNSDAYGYKIFDADFKEVQSGEYALPFDGNITIITNYHLTNNGECLISLTEFIKPVDRLFINNNSNFKAVHVYKLKNNILKEFSLELEGMRIEEMQLGSNDSSSYNLIGIYAKGNSYKSFGIFSLQIDAQKERVVNALIKEMVSLNMANFERQIDTYIGQKGIEKTIIEIIFSGVTISPAPGMV